MGEHSSHTCPDCGEDAPRSWEGESFGFDFNETSSAPGNSGVSKLDYPTADQAVGRDAEGRWREVHARNKVKDQVRAEGGHRTLQRRHVQEEGKTYIEYSAGSDKLVKARKELVKQANEAYSKES